MSSETWAPNTTDLPDLTPIRVPFADGPTDTMPLDWAEKFIRWVREHRPAVFMDAMQQGVFGIDPMTPTGRPKKK